MADQKKGASLLASGAGIAALFVSRPVLAIVLNLLIVVAGIAALGGVEIRELPNIDRPVITIRTDYDGATPDTIDKEITAVIEGAVARTPGVVSISSQSSAGQSRVTIEFDPSTDLNAAANDLRDAIGSAQAASPTIPKRRPSSRPTPIPTRSCGSRSPRRRCRSSDLTALVNDQIIDRLAAVEGVADVEVRGDREPLVRIIIDPDALTARGLAVNDLTDGARQRHPRCARRAGVRPDPTLLVRADASAKSAEEIAAIEINPNTRVGDIADVVFGPAERSTSLRMNGKTGIGLGIVRQAQVERPRDLLRRARRGRRAERLAARGREHHHHLRRRDFHRERDRVGGVRSRPRHPHRHRHHLRLPALGARSPSSPR